MAEGDGGEREWVMEWEMMERMRKEERVASRKIDSAHKFFIQSHS